MGLGITASGTCQLGDEITRAQVEAYLKGSFLPARSIRKFRNGWEVGLHPAAETVELAIEGGKVHFSAATHAAGPGYHVAICQLLEDISAEGHIEFDEIEDETGYWNTRDFHALQVEVSRWLESLAYSIGPGEHNIRVTLSPNVKYDYPGLIHTPVGSREREWVDAVMASPMVESAMYFPWWNEEQDGAFHLGMATSLIWTAVAWRAPGSPADRALLEEVVLHLEAAHSAGLRDLPWREWVEIEELLGNSAPVAVRQHAQLVPKDTPFAGYHRFPVTHSQPGAQIKLSGRFVEFHDPSCTVAFSDGVSSIFISRWTTPGGPKARMTPMGKPESHPWAEGVAFSKREKDGWVYTGDMVSKDHYFVLTASGPELGVLKQLYASLRPTER